MDERRGRRFESTRPPPYSFSQPAPMHICSLYGLPRSRGYHKRHPIAPGQTIKPGVCSRSSYAKVVTEMLFAKSPCPGVIVYEIHHHYHNHTSSGAEAPSPINSATELPGESSLAGRTELHTWRFHICTVPYIEKHGQGCLSPIRDESLPPVNRSNKPTLRRWFR
jgi:hypothetical protein